MNRRLPLAVTLLIASSASLAGAGSGQESVCDPDLVVEHASATAYRMRGDRCEGAHSLKISADTKLMVASLSTGIDFSLDSAAGLEVEWPAAPGGGPVNLRSRSLGRLRRGLFYRMDTVVPAGRTSFQWPIDVLAALRLGPSEVGAVAWTTVEVPGQGEARTVYLPLRLGQSGARPEPTAYRLLLIPAERLEEVFLTLSPRSDDGAAAPLIETRPLGLGYYPADGPTFIEIPIPEKPGFYRVDLGAQLYRDPKITVSTSLWLYHAGSPR